MKYKYLFFDMDGVLINSMEFHIKAWLKAFRKVNLKATYNEILEMAGVTAIETAKTIAKRNSKVLSDAEIDEINQLKLKNFKEIFVPKLYPNLVQNLNKLKSSGGKLYLVSGAHKVIVDNIVENHLKGIFDIVISSEDTKRGKPSPEPYLRALKLSGADKEHSVVIEDALSGVASANAAGIDVMALTTSFKKEKLMSATKIFESHKELFDYLME